METLSRRMQAGEDSVLVTILEKMGSAPRGAGAQMLVGQSGLLCGTVGGGAIEACAIDLCAQVLRDRSSRTETFWLDGSAGLNMVCGGGAKLLFSFAASADVQWESAAREASRRLRENEKGFLLLDTASGAARVADADGVEDCFALPLPVRQRVIVCGGGHVAQALVPVLAGVDFRVTVLENRAEFADLARFPAAERVVLGDYGDISGSLELREDDFFVIMTHGHVHDFALQEQLLRRECAYIGVMGSRRKIASVNARLLEAGIRPEALEKVHTPIGVAIGAVTPAEIAISVAAECIAVRAQIRGGEKTCPASL